MKLNKKLTIAEVETPLVDEHIILKYMQPGTAKLQIRSTAAPESFLGQAIRFALGWHVQGRLITFFSGFVESATAAGEGLVRLFCRETVAKLDDILPLALRHPTLKDVLAAYTGKTGLAFIVPDRAYAKTRIPAFYTLGQGLHGLQSLGAAFSIPDFFWQVAGDGRIFVGSYEDSAWYGGNSEVPEQFFSGENAGIGGKKSLPAVPAFRPGVILNGAKLQEVSLQGETMGLTCF